MKSNWIITSIISGIVAGITTFMMTDDLELSLISTILVVVIVLINNPKRRYMKAFWVILSMILILNKYYFELAGDISGIRFKLGSNEVSYSVSIFLIILAIACLILDYLERNGKLKTGSFITIKKNKVGDVNGDNNSINQTNV